ncbi:hypothetical protein BABINDRAFT_162143 [Babjeviella inositovora NRRL Y-12698]|uniref:Sedoheptulose 1,7-bisphosphatase n=1 Tax=Babjeviella inositovora NRRL Y-12698 TaxID=984486 RepID=A0A1E3QN16_9ASCO|nr:uncharacterized protein BABINDRAFT_162143 [Babjeviella inositovora NRRL Y-12698]ODQ79073.1 hypothetical protein BABINDRAFT_162143 [Babjeviella inositovora NRRL Y-12698]
MVSHKSATPRVIFSRHGQTEWSKSGQHTSVTDIPLTEFGIRQMTATGKALIGESPLQLIKPAHLTTVICSPRLRAQQTVELLTKSLTAEQKRYTIEINEDIREWDYGDYEGLLKREIQASRSERGLGDNWLIWRDGCENGETYEQATVRIDRLIAKIRVIHQKAFDEDMPCDVLVVGHGHILRCLAARWCGWQINQDPKFVLDAGGVGVLSYQHHCIDEPALYLTGAFVVPPDEMCEN